MLSRILFILIALQGLNTIQTAKRPFNSNLEISCDFLPPLVRHYGCSVRKMAIGRYSVNVMFELTRQMPANTEVSIIIYYKPLKGNKFVKLFDIKLRVCDVLDNALTIPMMRDIWFRVRRSGNLPITCPIKANTMYNVTDLIISNDIIPSYATNIFFNGTLTFYEKKKLLATMYLSGSTEKITQIG